MILKTAQNRAATAPEFPDLQGVIDQYNAWSEKDGAAVIDFLIANSNKREDFLLTLERKLSLYADNSVRQQYF